MIKLLAAFVAVVLALSLTTTVYAQAQNATSLQIQVVPQIQRGHQQHLTIFAVDDNGNQVNGSGEIISSIENEAGKLVGPKTVYTETGEDVAYKVGPNTRPQNISVNSCLTDSEICAEQSYYVFPKGQAQQPQPPTPEFPPAIPIPEEPEVPTNDSEDGEIVVPSNETEVTLPENATDVTVNDTGEAEPLPPITNETVPAGNETVELTPIPPVINETNPLPINETAGGNETIPVPIPINETQTNETLPIPELPTNATQNATVEPTPLPPTENGGGQTPNGTTPAEPEPETPANATDAFQELANATAIQDQKLDEVRDNANDTNRGELKALLSDTTGAIGGTSQSVIDATDEQLSILQNSFASGSESIDEIQAGNVAVAEEGDESQGENEDDQGEDEQQ